MDQKLLLGSRDEYFDKGDRYGGRPFVPKGFEWPMCQQCKKDLEFIGQLTYKGRFFSMFYCTSFSDDVTCETWFSGPGANKVFVFDESELKNARLVDGNTRDTLIGITAAPYPEGNPDYDDVRCDEGPTQNILGKIGGNPLWIQGDETPICGKCNKDMSFVAQLEEGIAPFLGEDVNYGGGNAYLFECEADKLASFLWQQ